MSKCFPPLKPYIDSLEHYYIQNLLIYSSIHLLIFCQKRARVKNVDTNIAYVRVIPYFHKKYKHESY